jgi:hypothetical protein
LRSDEHHKAQCEIVRYCRLRGGGAEWIYACPNGGKRSKTEAAKLKREGVLAGVWDLFMPVPNFRSLHNGLYVEVKVGEDKLSPEQIAFGEYVRRQGFATFVTRTDYPAQSGINAIEAYMIGEFIQGKVY